MLGISLSGENIKGPMPYASVYSARVRLAAVSPTWNSSMIPGMDDVMIEEPMYTAIV